MKYRSDLIYHMQIYSVILCCCLGVTVCLCGIFYQGRVFDAKYHRGVPVQCESQSSVCTRNRPKKMFLTFSGVCLKCPNCPLLQVFFFKWPNTWPDSRQQYLFHLTHSKLFEQTILNNYIYSVSFSFYDYYYIASYSRLQRET